MPWKYLGIIICLVILIIFIGFNLENKATVSFVFASMTDIPVYFLILFSFAVGAMVTIPVSIISRQRKKNKKAKEVEDKKNKKEEKQLKKSKKNEE
ncbi:MAG: LapA family protein [Spirochaetales bacterium]|nr:LapA family protein [Spirochaetales bacterium]